MSKLITPNGREILNKKIKDVEEKLKSVMSQKGDAYETGGDGWHDNFAFEQLVREEGMLAEQLASLRETLKNATIVRETAENADGVGIGCIVTLEDDDGTKVEYEVVGYGETDTSCSPKKIEYLAPLIEPFMEGTIGDEHTIVRAGKETTFYLTDIKVR